ncbi:hypothetical protein LTR56_001448 [Elasticomyces elasticus]|nr:hypothetical protein LTR56_001448 [Elasticomyces elasticus]KAK3668629.1 hypothetical protein LTR22_000516 [Elasticomyces elasticus]KAK4931981.1 hypothetical protein LTR49_001668 [Elasticomyces elasticus]KAK5768487.1 hypothetical protein LTS12_001275 [Elasticomyces elasticus]
MSTSSDLTDIKRYVKSLVRDFDSLLLLSHRDSCVRSYYLTSTLIESCIQFYYGNINDGQLKWLHAIGQRNRKDLRRVELVAWAGAILAVTNWTVKRLNPIKFQVEDATQRALEMRIEVITEIIGNISTPLVYPLTFL